MVGLFNLFGQSEGSSILNILSFLMIFVFIIIGPRLYLWQALTKIEATAQKLEHISKRGQKSLYATVSKKGGNNKETAKKLSAFMDFFMIPPVDMDPFGILKKMEHLIRNTEGRFKQVAKQVAPKANEEEMMNVYMGLQAAVTINMIAKIVRHWAEMIKKMKNFQLAIIFQMQMPMIEKIVEAEEKGLNAFLKGEAIGDAAGPLVIASLVDSEGKEVAEEVLGAEKKLWGRKLVLLKARGPGGRLGELGYAVENVLKKNKRVSKIITIDAAQKLEGEKTGSVCEGVGVAIGGAGIEKAKIEEIAVSRKLPLEAIAIKMSPFEAISPMPAEVANAVKKAVDLLRERVEETSKGSTVIVVGVGNTCGIPNSKKGLGKLVKQIKARARKIKQEEKAEDAGWFFGGKKGEEKLGESGMMANIAGFLFRHTANFPSV